MFSNQVTVNGRDVSVFRINNDVYGNPRYVVSWLSVPGAESYDEAVKIARDRIGGKKYRGKDFGGGIVFQSYNADDDIQRLFEE